MKAVTSTFTELLKIIKGDLSLETIKKFWSESRADAIVSLLLVFGLVVMFFNATWGGAIVGFIGGLYLFQEVLSKLADFPSNYKALGRFKFYILLALIIGLILYATTIVISLIVGVLVGDYVKNKLEE